MIDLILNNKEWLFSGVGVVVLGWLARYFHRPTNSNGHQSEKRNISDSVASDINDTHVSDEKGEDVSEKSKNVSIYYYEQNLDPDLTADEEDFLKRFCGLPQNPWTQGYRHDYLYNELLSDIPNSTVKLFLKSLELKGYLAIHKTDDNMYKYYQLSDNAVKYVVEKGFVRLSDA